MLKQGSISQLRTGELNRQNGYIVIAMAFYPRGLKKELADEYRSNLAPDRELFREWKEFEASHGHEAAFQKSSYEQRFQLPPDAWESLRRLTDVSRSKDVYLLCQCELGERCHREMVALAAQFKFKAEIAPLFNTYPVFESRLNQE